MQETTIKQRVFLLTHRLTYVSVFHLLKKKFYLDDGDGAEKVFEKSAHSKKFKELRKKKKNKGYYFRGFFLT